MLNNRRVWLVIGVIIAIPLALLIWWLASPLLREDEVNEDLPENLVVITPQFAANATLPAGIALAEAEATMSSAAAVSTPMDDPMPAEISSEQVTAVEVRRGQFRNGDSFHMGSGDAILYTLSTGEHLLRFENFTVTNGPDLHVYLVPRANAERVDISGYVDLGELKGNVGSQNYTLAASMTIPAEASIVIWCEPFGVLFSVATLE